MSIKLTKKTEIELEARRQLRVLLGKIVLAILTILLLIPCEYCFYQICFNESKNGLYIVVGCITVLPNILFSIVAVFHIMFATIWFVKFLLNGFQPPEHFYPNE
jgi:membrane-anchored glycerophosphoryl diester phosphodiesterase (GDPDase)